MVWTIGWDVRLFLLLSYTLNGSYVLSLVYLIKHFDKLELGQLQPKSFTLFLHNSCPLFYKLFVGNVNFPKIIKFDARMHTKIQNIFKLFLNKTFSSSVGCFKNDLLLLFHLRGKSTFHLKSLKTLTRSLVRIPSTPSTLFCTSLILYYIGQVRK